MKFNTLLLVLLLALSTSFVSRGAAVLVTTGTDGIEGSLRHAIAVSAAGDTVTFAPDLPRVLAIGAELLLDKDLTLEGPGMARLELSGGKATRILNVTNSAVVTIRNLTLSGGKSQFLAFDGGGAVRNSGTLTIIDCLVSSNEAHYGGGVYNAGTLTASNSLFVANRAAGGNGGAIAGPGACNLIGCTFSNNTAGYFGGAVYLQAQAKASVSGTTIISNVAFAGCGGGLWSEFGPVTINLSSIIGNLAPNRAPGIVYTQGSGGGLASRGGSFNVALSTISGNRAGQDGGGIWGAYSLSGCTIVSNSVMSGTGGGISGGGTVRSSIIARNGMSDMAGEVTSLGHNLIGIGDGFSGFSHGVNGDQVGTRSEPLDPRVGPLGLYGGSTLTHALFAGSPAIDKGQSYSVIDQRLRHRRHDNPNVDNAFGDGTDVGSHEVGPVRITGFLILAGQNVRLTFDSVLGVTYTIQTRPNLRGSSWITVGNPIAGTGSSAGHDLPEPVADQFYRISWAGE